MLECAYASGLASSGIDSVLIGVIPTPGVAWLTQQGDYRGGVMISASHNPVPDNGIKLFGEDGFKLNDEVSRRLEESMEGAEPGRGGFIADWIAMLDDASAEVRARHVDIDNREAGRAMEMAAVRVSIDNLRTFPCIQEKEKRGTLKLRGAFFAISDGVLHVMDDATGAFAPA